MSKRILTLALAALLVLSLAACGEDKKSSSRCNDKEHNLVSKYSVELGTPEKPLDPQQVYASVTYVPEMFYGHYRALNTNDSAGYQAFAKDLKTFVQEDNYGSYNCTYLPFQIRAGQESFNHVLSYVEGQNWMQLYQLRVGVNYSEFNLTSVYCAYTVEGNKLKCTPVESYELDENKKHVTSYVLSDTTWEYEFSFRGRELTLSYEGQSVTLVAGLEAYEDLPILSVDCYLDLDTLPLDGIHAINFYHRHTGEFADHIYVKNADNDSFNGCVGKLEENGLFTLTVPWDSGTKTYQMVYFLCDRDGLVLTDGENTYFYTKGYTAHQKQLLEESLPQEEVEKLEQLPDTKLEDIVEKKENLLEDLVKAFADEGIAVTVNPTTGELAMDASILFGGDSAQLTGEGKQFLSKFVKAYTGIVFSEKYDGFVSKTLVEGHTAPLANSTYESGLELSQKRADAVKDYCLSAETGVDTTKLAEAMEAIGLSNSKPVYDEKGNVDKAASRRVSFRFLIDLEQVN